MQFLDANGHPIVGGKLCSYQSNTTTPLATYTDSTANTPNTNPVITDSAGRVQVWLKQQGYKLVLLTGGDGTCNTGSVVWSADNILSVFQQVDQLNGLTGNVTLAGTANQVIITKVGQTLTFTLPQSIGTASSPHFSGLTLDTALALGAGGTITQNAIQVMNGTRDLNANSYSINGVGIVDSAKNAQLHAVTISGQSTPTIDNSNNISGHSLTIDGVIAIDNARNAAVQNLSIGGTCVGCNPGAVTSQSIGGHSVGTVYQNTGTTAKFVNVDVNLASGTTFNVYSDGTNPPTTVVGGAGTAGGVVTRATVGFWVLPNAYYKVAATVGSVILANWVEYAQ
jgi:hypothetical protein